MQLWRFIRWFVFFLLVGLTGYMGKGAYDAWKMAPTLAARADFLISDGRGPADLGPRIAWLLMVQDPGFATHSGFDISTPGAGLTTIPQSLAKRVGFENFTPGLQKLRQTSMAMMLERELTKDQIVALWLDTVEMGRGPDGWVTGFFKASDVFYDAAPANISDDAFIQLISVLIAPGALRLANPDATLFEQQGRQ
jgi:hypothetical protein